MLRSLLPTALALATALPLTAQQPDTAHRTLLVPAAVWDGVADAPQAGWVVLVRGSRIEAVGPASRVHAPAGAERVDLPGTTLDAGDDRGAQPPLPPSL